MTEAVNVHSTRQKITVIVFGADYNAADPFQRLESYLLLHKFMVCTIKLLKNMELRNIKIKKLQIEFLSDIFR